MKKLITITLTLFLLTGCGNTITCKTKKGDIREIYKIEYSDNTVTNLKITKTYKFDNKTDFKKYEPTMKYYTTINSENVKNTYKKKNKKYILTQIYNTQELTEEELTKYGLSKNKEELVEDLKNSGLTCK